MIGGDGMSGHPLQADEPDFHFLVLAPGLQAAWFFVAARRYWERFLPMVIDDLDLISYVPEQASVAITVLARPDTADYIRARIARQFPDARLDLITAETAAEAQGVLEWRAATGRRFG